jgi:hypothetical protein
MRRDQLFEVAFRYRVTWLLDAEHTTRIRKESVPFGVVEDPNLKVCQPNPDAGRSATLTVTVFVSVLVVLFRRMTVKVPEAETARAESFKATASTATAGNTNVDESRLLVLITVVLASLSNSDVVSTVCHVAALVKLPVLAEIKSAIRYSSPMVF